MDELLGTFIRTNFTEELVEEIYKSFGIFGLFNHGDGFEAFDGLLNMEEVDDASALSDTFIDILNKQLDYLLEHHTLKLSDEATIEHKNEVLRGLYMLQYLVDYNPITLTLESECSNEVKICRILEDLTSYDESFIMSILEGYRDSFVQHLKEFVYSKEAEAGSDDSPVATVGKHLKVYHALFGVDEFSQAMVDAKLLPAQSFKDYLPFLSEELVVQGSVEDTAKRIYWLLLMSSDGTENPLMVFREHSLDILSNVDVVTKVEQRLLSFIGRFEELKKVLSHEKA